jgi:hypothetical protein
MSTPKPVHAVAGSQPPPLAVRVNSTNSPNFPRAAPESIAALAIRAPAKKSTSPQAKPFASSPEKNSKASKPPPTNPPRNIVHFGRNCAAVLRSCELPQCADENRTVILSKAKDLSTNRRRYCIPRLAVHRTSLHNSPLLCCTETERHRSIPQ